MSRYNKKQLEAGGLTGENCPDCGSPTVWEEEVVPVRGDIPDYAVVGLYEACPKCSWTKESEAERLDSIEYLPDQREWLKCPLCDLVSVIENRCVECEGVMI